MQLYVDGALVSTSGNTAAQDYAGYWRVGGDSGWEGDAYWRGSVDEVAVYPMTLTAQQVGGAPRPRHARDRQHRSDRGASRASRHALSVGFDGTTSSDVEGPIASYAWNFGDGADRHRAPPRRTSSRTAARINVTLTVARREQAPPARSRSPWRSLGANVLPTSSFTASVTHLRATFDASASSDIDGRSSATLGVR